MKKQISKYANPKKESKDNTSIQVSHLLILVAYALITVLTPNLQAYDSNGPKFLALSVLNFFAFFYIIRRKGTTEEINPFGSFLKNTIGLVYTFFLVVLIISFVKALNIPEAIITFVKYFTVFFSAVIISIMLRNDKRLFRSLVILLVFLLLVDCLTVFYHVQMYIAKLVPTISDIISVYSNKNILASAIFVKIPFALWLFTYEKGWVRKLGLIALFCAFLATFYMSTRSFYVGLIILMVVYSILFLFKSMRNSVDTRYTAPVYLILSLVLAFSLYSITQKYFYPKNKDGYNVTVKERISTIYAGESSAAARLASWERSAILFKQNPLLGVGIGNWKIEVLKYENPTKPDFSFMLRNHNDFIEITTETGIFGGLLFIALFVILMFNFVKTLFKQGTATDLLSYRFLPAFGILCYSFDAFFNFPADRPEIQTLFAIFIGAGVTFSPSIFQNRKFKFARWKKVQYTVFSLLLILSSYVLYVNFVSLKLQRLVNEDILEGRFSHPSSLFMNEYPSIPTVSIVAEPIAVNKSRYLINEGKNQEAIDLLLPDRSSPYLGAREVFLSLAYSKIGNIDSVLFYAQKAHALKPRYYDILNSICQVLEIKNKRSEAANLIAEFLTLEKTTSKAWLDLTNLYWKNGEYQKAVQTIDSAAVYLPNDSTILQKQTELSRNYKIIPLQQTYLVAMDCLSKKKFPEALKYLNEFISKETGVAIVYAGRAYCYYYGNEFEKSISDINRSITLGNNTPDLVNLRGLCLKVLGKKDDSCKDFRDAASRGDKDAINNVQRFCK